MTSLAETISLDGKTTSSTASKDNKSPKKQSNQKALSNFIDTEVQDKIMDNDLIAYQFFRDAMGEADKRGDTMFFDTSTSVPISALTYGNSEINRQLLVKNTRWITFNIPAIDALSRSNPLIKKAVNYLSSKPLINGIDINSNKLESDELYGVSRFMKNLYASLRSWLSKGITYGGSGGLMWFVGDDNRDLSQPLTLSKIKKNSFSGIKPLSRWFQIEPDLSSPLIQNVDKDRGITDARMVGMPEYYNVSLDGGMIGDPRRKQFRVHVSRLILFNAEMPSFIETQIERYWGASIVELAWNDLNIDNKLWKSTAKTLDKNNMGVYKIDGLGLAGATMGQAQRNKFAGRMALLKEASSYGVVAIDGKDEFDFAQAALSGYSDILNIDHRRLAGAFRVPLSVLFPGEKSDDEDKLYLQSLAELQDIQELYLRPALNVLLPVIIKSELNKTVEDINYIFNPIETQTLMDKASMFKTMVDGIKVLKEIGAIDTSSAIRMVDDINKNPLNISQNITEGYRKSIMDEAEKGIFHTHMSDQIELAKELNQAGINNQNGGGVSGVNNPESSMRGKNEGGDPTKSKRLFKRHTLNEDKGKE